MNENFEAYWNELRTALNDARVSGDEQRIDDAEWDLMMFENFVDTNDLWTPPTGFGHIAFPEALTGLAQQMITTASDELPE